MRRSLINILAAIGVAVALSGCIIAPGYHRGYGYGPGPGPGPAHYQNGY